MTDLSDCVASAPIMHVAAGVVFNGAGNVLIARRPDHLHQGGLWEFPGGKVEAHETVEEALRRELQEELAITIGSAVPLISVRHAYPDRQIRLEVFRVDRFDGEPAGMLGQAFEWVKPDGLTHYPFPAANRPVVTAARLPDCLGIVDINGADRQALMRQLNNFARAGVALLRLRARSASPLEYIDLARIAAGYCKASGIRLLLDSDAQLAMELGASGIHLSAHQLGRIDSRPADHRLFVGASCHNLAELIRAESIGVDFAMLSPVCRTESHPDRDPIGWALFSDWVSRVNLPVFALGGMTPGDLPVAKCHGAQGIAGIRRLCGA